MTGVDGVRACEFDGPAIGFRGENEGGVFALLTLKKIVFDGPAN